MMSGQPKTVKIMLDYLQGPIWLSDIETGAPNTGIDVVDTDPVVRELNGRCAELFNGYYEFDSHGQPCWFNYKKEKEDKGLLLGLIAELLSRLNEINDGSYVVEDCVTERIKNL